MTIPALPTLLEVLTVIGAILINDISWALYIRRVQVDAAVRAAGWAVVIFVSSAIATYSWIHNPWLIAVAGFTTFFGTYGVIKWDSRRNPAKKN